MMVGRWVSFWDCLFLGATLNFRGVTISWNLWNLPSVSNMSQVREHRSRRPSSARSVAPIGSRPVLRKVKLPIKLPGIVASLLYMTYEIISCYIMLYHVISCYIMLCHVILYIWYHAILYHIMLYYIISCYILHSCTAIEFPKLLLSCSRWRRSSCEMTPIIYSIVKMIEPFHGWMTGLLEQVTVDGKILHHLGCKNTCK